LQRASFHRVTLTIAWDSVAYVDGAADTDLTVGTTQSFGGGTLSRLADNVYRLGWNTGQSVTVMNWGALFDWTVSLAASDGPGSVRGLLGSNSGAENTFQLPDGTNLGWLSDDQILGRFADAWRVAPAASLMNDPPAANLALLAQTMATNFDPGATGTTSGPVHNDTQDHADPLLAASPLHG
jgi:hypothetical protein